MKLESVIIEGFRAFNQGYEFPLDERLTVFVGPNGTGKTSFCDAVEWAMLGKLPQYRSIEATLEDMVINRNNPKREAKVILSLSDGKRKMTSQRSIRSKKVWKPTKTAKLQGDKIKVVPDEYLATVYLRQEALREFIGTKPDKRRPVLSSLLGLEYIEALVRGVEESEKLIGGNKSSMATDAAGHKEALEEHEAEYASLSSSKSSARKKLGLTQTQFENQLKVSSIISASKNMYSQLQSIGKRIDSKIAVEFKEDLPTASLFLERLPEALKEWKQKVSEKLVQAEELNVEYEEIKQNIEAYDEKQISRDIEKTEKQITIKKNELKTKDSFSKLVICGEDFLRSTKPKKCPLCDSDMPNISNVLRRLSAKTRKPEMKKEIKSLYKKISDLEQNERELRGKLVRLREWERRKKEIEGMPKKHDYEELKKVEKSLGTISKDTGVLTSIYAIFKKEKELADRKLLSKEEIRDEEMKLKKLKHLHKLVQVLCEQLQNSSPLFISRKIGSLNPIINEYAEILSPHPTFSRLGIARDERGYWLQGISKKNEKTYVQTLFSTGQLNEAAVLILLAMARKALHPLKFVILDDPSQSLDTNGKKRLAELLARASKYKQMIVSTMDIEFANFLKSCYPQAKLYKFTGYRSERGPVVENL